MAAPPTPTGNTYPGLCHGWPLCVPVSQAHVPPHSSAIFGNGPRSFLPSLHSRGSLFTCFCIILPPASQMQALCDQGGLSYVPSTYSRARYSAVACVIFTEFTNGRGALGDKFSLGRYPRCLDCSVSVTAIVLVPTLLPQGASSLPQTNMASPGGRAVGHTPGASVAQLCPIRT